MMLINSYRFGAAAWSPLLLPSIYAAYDTTDISTLWQDSARTTPVTAAGDPVGCIDDITGNGHHLLQATSTSRGLWQSTGGILMDGVDDNYAEASGSNIAIPVYMAMAYNKTSTSGVSIFRLSPASNVIYVYLAGANSTTTGFGTLQTRNGTAESAHTANSTWNAGGPAVVLDGLLVAGTSDVQINNDPLVSAANTQASGTTMTDAMVRLSGSGFSTAAPGGIFHGGIVALADPGAQRANAKTWLAARAGITI